MSECVARKLRNSTPQPAEPGGDRARKEVRRHGYHRRSASLPGGGGALYWFACKPKADTWADDLDDYYGEDEEDEDYGI